MTALRPRVTKEDLTTALIDARGILFALKAIVAEPVEDVARVEAVIDDEIRKIDGLLGYRAWV